MNLIKMNLLALVNAIAVTRALVSMCIYKKRF